MMSAGKKATGGAVQERVVELGEYKVNVASSGDGPTILMIHGEEKRPSWKDWEGFLVLADGYRVIIPDLVGFGGSSRPIETPDYSGQVALEVAISWPETIESLLLVASTYDKSQLARLSKVRKPSLVIWAEDDLVTQLKAGYLLRDAIRTSRLEVLPPVAKDPRHDFTIAHQLLKSRKEELLKLFRAFLSSPSGATAEPPELEKELRGMAMKRETEEP
jgi:pimeloyl-ACP methyl ester carboxylesterase